MVVNIVIAQWFLRRRGRALALSSMGVGFAKVCMPLFAASLMVWLGWRPTWSVFGLVTLVLAVGPSLLFIRRSPEDMGFFPDGSQHPFRFDSVTANQQKTSLVPIIDKSTDWEGWEDTR